VLRSIFTFNGLELFGEWSGQQDLNLRSAVPKPGRGVHKDLSGNHQGSARRLDFADSALYQQSKHCRVASGNRLLKIPRCFHERGLLPLGET
jgi:hypothetical protein